MNDPDKSKIKRKLGPGDIIVLPEYIGNGLHPCGFGSKLVIFNQNAHYTFNGFGYSDDRSDFVYRGSLLGALAVSKHTSDYLSYAFPGLPIFLTPNGVDGATFFPGKGGKKRQIAFMPRKLPTSIVQVVQILRGRGALKGWDLCPIDGMDESDVARALRESAIFLSTSNDEGFGLPPLEAGASGCVVIGYTGYAAREFMLPEYCYPIAQGDVLAFAKALENVILEFNNGPDRLLQQAADYAEFLRTHYSKETEGRGVVSAWKALCPQNEQRRSRQASSGRVASLAAGAVP